jgi:nucleotide-binding universal stress UspA family protein
MFRSIVVGTDGSESAAIAVAGAAEIARLTGATLHVATVGGATTSAMLGDPLAGAAAMSVAAEETRDELNEIVEHAAAPARAEGVTVATHTLIGSAAQALCDLAESVGADLLVVGNRGMKGGRRFLGSVPNTISHHAPCSVLIYETTQPHDQPTEA